MQSFAINSRQPFLQGNKMFRFDSVESWLFCHFRSDAFTIISTDKSHSIFLWSIKLSNSPHLWNSSDNSSNISWKKVLNTQKKIVIIIIQEAAPDRRNGKILQMAHTIHANNLKSNQFWLLLAATEHCALQRRTATLTFLFKPHEDVSCCVIRFVSFVDCIRTQFNLIEEWSII